MDGVASSGRDSRWRSWSCTPVQASRSPKLRGRCSGPPKRSGTGPRRLALPSRRAGNQARCHTRIEVAPCGAYRRFRLHGPLTRGASSACRTVTAGTTRPRGRDPRDLQPQCRRTRGGRRMSRRTPHRRGPPDERLRRQGRAAGSDGSRSGLRNSRPGTSGSSHPSLRSIPGRRRTGSAPKDSTTTRSTSARTRRSNGSTDQSSCSGVIASLADCRKPLNGQGSCFPCFISRLPMKSAPLTRCALD